MENFFCLHRGLDVVPLVNALKTKPELWDQDTLRTTHEGTAHTQVSDILLRFNDYSLGHPESVIDERECINCPAIFQLPQAQNILFWLMSRVQGERLGRAIITRLSPGKSIEPHIDQGSPADYYDRYQIALHSHKGCVFRAGGEQVTMLTGDVWWFDNKQEHEVVNNSADDRLSLIVDILSFK
jgi:hypothetical protein|tara:strand:- start:1117 stop:1665 length:549 start_codon:yes stop_codon:yes gene_type:complete